MTLIDTARIFATAAHAAVGQKRKYTGEDYLFCDRAREAGFEVWVDVEISLPHVGVEKFTRDFNEDVLQPLLEQHCTPVLKVVNG